MKFYRGVPVIPNVRGHSLTPSAIDMTEWVREHDEVARESGIERTVRHDTSIYSRFDRQFTYRQLEKGNTDG